MFRSKNATKILSLLLAIVLWAYVIAIENPTTTKKFESVPVQLLKVETLAQSDLALMEGSSSALEIIISGKRSEISKINKDQLVVTANVLGYTAGEHYVDVNVDISMLPPSVSLVEVKPKKIPVVIDRLIAVYKPVSLQFSGAFPENMEAGRISLQPKEIEVSGAKTLVESVVYVSVEVPVDQIRKTNTALSLDAVALNDQGLAVPNVKLSSNRVDVNVTLLNTKTVPLTVEITGQVSDKYEITNIDIPQAITIRGSEADLDKIDLVTGQPINISGITETTEIPIKIELPRGVETNGAALSVKIGIKGISTAEYIFNMSEIDINGLTEGRSAYINTPNVTLKAVGKEAVLSNTAKDDFMLSVDLTGLEPGIHTVPVVVSTNKIINNIEIIPAEVHITLNEIQ